MKKLGYDLELMIARLSGNDEQARINLRAHQVRDRYKQALETVYKNQAPLFLAHTNNVYIIKKDGKIFVKQTYFIKYGFTNKKAACHRLWHITGF